MPLRDMFKKTYIKVLDTDNKKIPEAPEGLWRKCKKCNSPIYVEDVRANHYVCPKCMGYFRVHAYRRIEMLVDKGSFKEWNKTMPISNPLNFPNYEEKLKEAKEKSHLDEAVVTGKASIEGINLVLAVCDARFMMSSMGHNLGEKITFAIEEAARLSLPVVIYACSGGARMQEGIVSLMQMAKTSAALKKLHDAGQVFISVLTDPTTGGVTASFAMLGDIILAEPKALIGFAGPRVIAQTIGAKLPEGFQRSEFLLEHGFIDAIVERKDQRETLVKILKLHKKEDIAFIKNQIKDMDTISYFDEEDENKLERTAWDSVLISRSANRPTGLDYINELFDDFIELHGDRCYGDDGAIVGGIASFRGVPVTVIAQQKGKNLKDNKIRNFGMPSPEGYRKALRLMKQANDFSRPIICFVDTPGAFCGLEAEERGQGEAIAKNLYEMSAFKVPILSIVIGEGGSGGALAMAVSNEVWMLEHAIYSILSPEGFASILYKDAKLAKEAAHDMKITSKELKKLGIIDRIIPERENASLDNIGEISSIMDKEIIAWIVEYMSKTEDELIEQRYLRYRKF